MAYRFDLQIDQGASYALDIECQDENGQPADLAGCQGAAHIRYRQCDPAPAAVFVCTVNQAQGVLSLELNPQQTAALTKTYGVWDCELTSQAGVTQRLAQGKVAISPEVTR